MNAIKEFTSYMQELGAVQASPGYWNPLRWVIETIYGKLEISLHESDFCKGTGKPRSNHSNFVSIYSRFKDVDRARDFLIQNNGNRFSGKWNFHEYGSNTVEQIWTVNFERFKSDLEKILVDKKESIVCN